MSPHLTPEQRVAIEGLASGHTVQKAAELAGVSSRTLLRWKKLPAFKASLEQVRNSIATASIEIIQESKLSAPSNFSERIIELVDQSFTVLEEVITNRNEATRNRLKAIDTVGNWAGLRYAQELNRAIELVEKSGFKVIVEDEEDIREWLEFLEEKKRISKGKKCSAIPNKPLSIDNETARDK